VEGYYSNYVSPFPHNPSPARPQPGTVAKKRGCNPAPLTPPSRPRHLVPPSHPRRRAAVSSSPSRPRPRTRGRCHRRLALTLAASAAAAPSLFNYPGSDWTQQRAAAGLPSVERCHQPTLSLVRCPWWPALGLAQCRRRPALVLTRRRGCRPALACARRGENDYATMENASCQNWLLGVPCID